jgi:dephospho-CoA kinase
MLKLVQGKDNVVIAGFRIIEEVNIFKENFENFILILVSASAEIRYQRELTKRQISKEDFLKRDVIDLENLKMQQVFDSADYKIDNGSTLEELHNTIDNLMGKI